MRIWTVTQVEEKSFRPSLHSNGVKPLGSTVSRQSYLSLYLQSLLPFVRKSRESETLRRGWKNGIIVKIPKKVTTGFEYLCAPYHRKDNSWIASRKLYRRRASTTSTPYGSNKQCTKFRSSLPLLFINFEKAFDSVYREYIWSALHRRGIPEKLIAIHRATYESAKVASRHRYYVICYGKNLFHLDNAPCQKNNLTMAKIHETKFELLKHPLYSPLATINCFQS